jgi:hypothetical protein
MAGYVWWRHTYPPEASTEVSLIVVHQADVKEIGVSLL